MANVSYPIPPWISNLPDPVQAYSHGLQIGAQVGESQARQQLAQEQMLRQQQKDMVESEIEKQKFQLQADEKAREYSAQQKFTSLIQGGMDPLQAILQTPEIASKMGPAVSAIRAGQISPFEQARLGIEQQRLDIAKKPKLIHTAGGAVYRERDDGTIETVVPPSPKMSETKKALLKNEVANLSAVQKMIDANPPQESSYFGLVPGNKAKREALQKQAQEIKARIASYDTDTPAKSRKIGRFDVSKTPTTSADTEEETSTDEGD